MSIWVKICGVTSVENAIMVAESGVDAIGLNFAPASPRCISLELAAQIVKAVPSQVELVGVFVDAPRQLLDAAAEAGIGSFQLHGSESPAQLSELLATGHSAFKALRIGEPGDVELASAFGGPRILVDAKVKGAVGGTGHSFDWSLIQGLNEERDMVLAGGLKPENVADAVTRVRPYGVDTASGVESSPGIKDAQRCAAFVKRARAAACQSSGS